MHCKECKAMQGTPGQGKVMLQRSVKQSSGSTRVWQTNRQVGSFAQDNNLPTHTVFGNYACTHHHHDDPHALHVRIILLLQLSGHIDYLMVLTASPVIIPSLTCSLLCCSSGCCRTRPAAFRIVT